MNTRETTVAHPYRYGNITRREGPRGTSWHARIRNPRGDTPAVISATRHSYAAICTVLEQWNAERETMFLQERASR